MLHSVDKPIYIKGIIPDRHLIVFHISLTSFNVTTPPMTMFLDRLILNTKAKNKHIRI